MEKLLKVFDLEDDKLLNSITPTPSGHFYSPFIRTVSLRRSNQMFPVWKVIIDKQTNSVKIELIEEWERIMGHKI